jgi:crotonobetainyl-CoA hydratase
LPETGLGILPDAGGVLRLPRRLPRPLAVELILTGRRLTAQQAFEHGLVNQVVARDQLLAAARDLAARIVRSAPLAVAAVLEILAATEGGSVAGGYATMRSGQLRGYAAMLASEDAIEGPIAFVERRSPIWKGR